MNQHDEMGAAPAGRQQCSGRAWWHCLLAVAISCGMIGLGGCASNSGSGGYSSGVEGVEPAHEAPSDGAESMLGIRME